MKIINHSILGSGLSAVVKNQIEKNSTIFSNFYGKKVKSKRFYELQSFGGNTNIWGGYINYKKFKIFMRNKKFKSFIQNNDIFEIKKFIMDKKLNFTNILYRRNKKEIFRIKRKDFKSKIVNTKIEKLELSNKFITLYSKKKRYKSDRVSLCIGNLGLLELMHNSNFINMKDKISFVDGNCAYNINFFLNIKKSYYIPMSLKEIFFKLIYGKIDSYKNNINKTLMVQQFSYNHKKYVYTLEEILSYKSNHIRYFLSNHIVDLRINNIPIRKYINNISKKIKIYGSGNCKKYLPGPISQNLIYDAIVK